MKLGRVAVDGTKVKANASKHKAMSYGRMAEKEAALQAGSERAAAARRAGRSGRGRAVRAPTGAGTSCRPSWPGARAGCRRSAEAKAALEAEAREQRPRRRARIQSRGHRRRRRSATSPIRSRRSRRPSDGFIQGYNAQVAVDAHAQIIVAQHVTPAAPDVSSCCRGHSHQGRVCGASPSRCWPTRATGRRATRSARAEGHRRVHRHGRDKHGARPAPAPRGRPRRA